MNKEILRAIVYPYDVQFAPVLRHKALLENIEIVGVVSPFGSGLCGKDAGAADKGGEIGIVVEENFDKALEACDAVIFSETEMEYSFPGMIYPKIVKAAESGKDIILGIKVSKDIHDDIKSMCESCNVGFAYPHTKAWVRKELEPDNLKAHVIHNIDVPVVFVLGDGERTRKFETQLVLREFFMNKGYKVSQVGSREYCELLGFHSIPTYMYEPRLEMEKIYLFNKFVKNIELDERPDVIIIGVPGGIMSLNNNNTTYCGITAYEISNAVSPDTAVFCMYDLSWNEEYYDDFKQVIKHKFGFDVQSFVLSNFKIDWAGMNEGKNKLHFFHLNNDKIEAQKKELKSQLISIYNISNQEDAAELGNDVLNKLVSFAEVECF